MRGRDTGAGILIVVALVAAASAGVYKIATAFAQRRMNQTSQAWADARACLLGPALDADETVHERVFRIYAARERLPHDRRFSARGGPVSQVPRWPSKCREDLVALADQRGGAADLPGLAGRLAEHLKARDDARLAKQPWIELDEALIDALNTAASTLEPRAPAPGHAITEVSPRPIPAGMKLADALERYPGSAGLFANGLDHQAFDRVEMSARNRGYCAIGAANGKPLSAMTCTTDPRARPQPGYRAPDGSEFKLVTGVAPPAQQPKPRPTLDLQRLFAGRVESLRKMDGDPSSAFIAGRLVAWHEGSRWMKGSLQGKAPWLGEVSLLAEDGALLPRTCRAPGHTVVAMMQPHGGDFFGGGGGEGRGGFKLFFPEGEGWSRAAEIKWEPGSSSRKGFGPRTLSCSDSDARVASAVTTWDETVVDATEATRWICTKAACAEERVALGRLDLTMMYSGGNWSSEPDQLSVPFVVDLGPRTLVVWRSNDAIWARLAPFAELGTARDQILAGGDGDVRVAFSYETVITRDRTALLFFMLTRGEKQGLLTVRADADGDLRVLGAEPGERVEDMPKTGAGP
jgi:hypothetical protein